jgi:uncharacterized protein YfaA (DUF2138 family)
MLIQLFPMGPMQGKVVEAPQATSKEAEPLLLVETVQFSKMQRNLLVIPFEVRSNTGVCLDKGCITVNSVNGKLGVDHQVKEIVSPADAPKAKGAKP